MEIHSTPSLSEFEKVFEKVDGEVLKNRRTFKIDLQRI